MATIQAVESKSGTKYRAIVRLKGYPAQSATFDRKTDAKTWAKQTESAIKEKRYFKQIEAEKHTVKDAIDRYIKTGLTGKKSAADTKRHLEFWSAKIGSYTLADCTPALIGAIKDELLQEPIVTEKKVVERIKDTSGKTIRTERIVKTERKRNGATVNRYLAALSKVLSEASREWQWIDANPMMKVKSLPESRGRVRYLDDDERERFLSACQESKNPYLYIVVIVALSTGMRHGEIMNLTWWDIDFTNRRILLMETKNGERRYSPLVGKAYDLLKSLKDDRDARQKSAANKKVVEIANKKQTVDYVFPAQGVTRKGHTSLRSAFLTAVKKAELTNFRFHDLRHTAASYLAMNGATLHEIAAILGHKTLQMVQRYAHLSDKHLHSTVERMNQKMFGG